jgi:hypothetical protein
MGYTTNFDGVFKFNKPLDKTMIDFLIKFSETRHCSEENHNKPPLGQPGLWCQWTPSSDGTQLVWDGGEKFYNYIEWLEYLIDNVLTPKGYKLTGDVRWRGEDFDDIGVISVKDSKIGVLRGTFI